MVYLEWAGKLISNVKGFYSEMNPATLTGAIDVIIIKQEDGTYKTSPWHIRFGKMGVFWANENNVDIEINGKSVDLQMRLGAAGEAFFLQELEDYSMINNNGNNIDPKKSSGYDGSGVEESVYDPQQLRLHDQEGDQINKIFFQSEEFERNSVEKERTYSNLDKTLISEENIFDLDMEVGEPKLLDDLHHALISTPSDDEYEEELRTPFPKMRCNSLPEIHLDEMGIVISLENNILSGNSSDAGVESGSEEDPGCIVGSLPSRSSDFLGSSRQIQTMSKSSTASKIDDDVYWKWGQLPVSLSNNNNDKGLNSPGDPEDQLVMMKGQGHLAYYDDAISDKKEPSANQMKGKKEEGKGIYLEELTGDPELMSMYLYSNIPNQSMSKKDVDCSSDPGLPASPFSAPHSPIPFDDKHSTRARALSCSASDREGGSLVSSSSRLTMDQSSKQQPSSTTTATSTNHQQSSSPYSFTDLSISLCGGVDDLSDSALREKFEKFKVTYDQFCSNPNVLGDPSLIVLMDGKFYKWAVAGAMVISHLIFKKPLPDEARESLMKLHMPRKGTSQRRGWLGWWSTREKATIGHTTGETAKSSTNLAADSGNDSDGSVNAIADGSSSVAVVQQPSTSDKISTKENNTTSTSQKTKERYFRSLELTSKQIELLNLKEGLNEATFSVTTKYQGTTKCSCSIFLWNWCDKIVISDIDGTITKSDVLGQVLPIISSMWSDWSQVGIANLYTLIHQNGYKFIYLSARAIGQSRLTRDYLRSVKQGDYLLPEGPLLLSPSSLRSAFHKEVIERKPEEFKIKCLKNILSLFPPTVTNPFTAGFGNRLNDVWAYNTVGIPKSRIFIVNKKGQLRIEKSTTFSSTYSKLSDLVDQIFPSVAVDPEYSSFNYWRDPGHSFSEEEALLFLGSRQNKNKGNKLERAATIPGSTSSALSK